MENDNHLLALKIREVKALGQIVRTYRKKMKLSQARLAGVCNVGIRFISDLENGKPTVELGKVLLVLQGLGLELMVKKKRWD